MPPRRQQNSRGAKRKASADRRNAWTLGIVAVAGLVFFGTQRSMNEAMESLNAYSIIPDSVYSNMTSDFGDPAAMFASLLNSSPNDGAPSWSSAQEPARSPRTMPVMAKTSGKHWKLWDQTNALPPPRGSDGELLKCRWGTYKAAHAAPNTSSSEAPMCMYDQEDYLTSKIIEHGRWKDCDVLTPILRRQKEANPDDPLIHVEIGANIGSCVLQVLLTTDAVIYAFEPHPRNLFHLTSTIANLDESYRKRVHLFPVALSTEVGEAHMIIYEKNNGNAQVLPPKENRMIADNMVAVSVERMDDLLQIEDTGSPISQIKMDAQGFECFIVQGMPNLLKKTLAIVFEVEKRQMIRVKDFCTPKILVDSIQNANFDLFPLSKEGFETSESLPDFSRFKYMDAIDLIARKKKET